MFQADRVADKKVMGLLSKTLWLSAFLATHAAWAGRIIQVDRTLSLENKPSELTDYIVNMGQMHGLENGTWLDVYRRRPVADMVSFKKTNDLRVWVGQLEVVYAQNDMAVTRLRGIANPNEQPLLDYPLPLMGDWVEVGRARKPTSIKTERVPGMIKVTQSGKRYFLKKDAKRYVRRIVGYLKKHKKRVRALHLVGRSRKNATTVAQEIRKQFGNRAPAMRFIQQDHVKKMPAQSVLILVKRI